MFDDQGIYHDDMYHQPSSGGLAGLDVMNAVQSYQNYRRAREAETLGTMLKLGAAGTQGTAVGGTPEGGQAESTLGISPESINQMWEEQPQQKFSKAVATMPQEQQTPQNLFPAAMKAGLPALPLLSGEGRLAGVQVREDQARTAEARERGAELANAHKVNMQYTDDPSEAAMMDVSQYFANPAHAHERENPDIQKGMQDYIAGFPTKAGGVMGGKAAVSAATVTKFNAQTKVMLDKLPDQLALMESSAGAKDALANMDNARATWLQNGGAGTGLKAKDLLEYSKKLEGWAVQVEQKANNPFSPVGDRLKAKQEAKAYREKAQQMQEAAMNPGAGKSVVTPGAAAPKAPAAAGLPAGALVKATGIPDQTGYKAANGKTYDIKGGYGYAPGF